MDLLLLDNIHMYYVINFCHHREFLCSSNISLLRAYLTVNYLHIVP